MKPPFWLHVSFVLFYATLCALLMHVVGHNKDISLYWYAIVGLVLGIVGGLVWIEYWKRKGARK
jgi:hypothetical protein